MAKQKIQNSLNTIAQLNPEFIKSLNGIPQLKSQGSSSNQTTSNLPQSQGTQNQSGSPSQKK